MITGRYLIELPEMPEELLSCISLCNKDPSIIWFDESKYPGLIPQKVYLY